jgi:hypothetical protein
MTAVPVYEKLMDTYRKIYSRNTTGKECNVVKNANVLTLLESGRASTERTGSKDGWRQAELPCVRPGHAGGLRRDGPGSVDGRLAFVCMRCNRLKRSKDLLRESLEILQRIG